MRGSCWMFQLLIRHTKDHDLDGDGEEPKSLLGEGIMKDGLLDQLISILYHLSIDGADSTRKRTKLLNGVHVLLRIFFLCNSGTWTRCYL